MKLTGWGELSSQLAELSPGTPTIAVGKVSTSEKDEKRYLNYNRRQSSVFTRNQLRRHPKKRQIPKRVK
jgi:hypothetical protein